MKKIEISPKTIGYLIITPLILYFVWLVKDLLFSLLIAFILMSALKPAVAKLREQKIPHGAAVGMVFLSFILVLIILISVIIPPIVTETTNLVKNAPSIIKELNPALKDRIENITQYLPTATNQAFQIIMSIFSNTLFVVSTLFFSFYFLMDEDIIKEFLTKYLSKEDGAFVMNSIQIAENRMSSWFWGQITLMTVVGSLTYLGLLLLGVKYTLALAVLAGLLEVVPNIGPLVSAIPTVAIGFTQSPFIGISAIVLYIVVQQLENNIIVPLIMKRAVGINPIVTLMALFIGGRVAGVLGMLLAIPSFLLIETFITEYQLRNAANAEKLRK